VLDSRPRRDTLAFQVDLWSARGALPKDLIDVEVRHKETDDKVCNIVHLIYRSQKYEGIAKDFEFSRRTMEEHWKSCYENARDTLANPHVLQLPDRIEGVRTFDIDEDRAD
jgi:NTE family protein